MTNNNPEAFKLKEEDHVDKFFSHQDLHKDKTEKDFEEDEHDEKEWYFEEDKEENTTYIKFVGEVESKAS